MSSLRQRSDRRGRTLRRMRQGNQQSGNRRPQAHLFENGGKGTQEKGLTQEAWIGEFNKRAKVEILAKTDLKLRG